jgi:hypothetical protein
VRNILIFLIEKLPKQDDIVSAGSESFLTRMKISVAGKVDKELKSNKKVQYNQVGTLECETFCSCLKCYPSEQAPNMFDILPRETRNSAFGNSGFNIRNHSLFPSVIDTHAVLKTELNPKDKEARHQQTKVGLMNVIKDEFLEAQQIIENNSKENNVVDKSLLETFYMPNTSDKQNDAEVKTVDVTAKAVESEMKKKKELVEQKQEKEKVIANKTVNYKDIRSAIMKHNKSIADLKLRKKEVEETLNKSNEELEKHEKILHLLPDGEENLNKLINIVQKSKDRLEGLKTQWENHKAPMEKEYQQTMDSIETMEGIAKKGKRSQPSLLEKYEKVQNDIKEKEVQYRKLIKVAETITEGETRDSYTKRILDILKQIEKLRDGIDAVIGDVKGIQKDINMLNGKLERSYFEINMTMKSRMNNKDPFIEQSMLINKQIHELCFLSVETIRKTGALSRDTRDLEEQIRAEESKGLKAKIERLSEDFSSLQSENKELAKQYKKAFS